MSELPTPTFMELQRDAVAAAELRRKIARRAGEGWGDPVW